MDARQTEIDNSKRVGRLRMWYAVLGAPLAWFVHLLGSYSVVPVVCHTPVGEWLFHAITAVTAVGCVVALWFAAGMWRRFRYVHDHSGQRLRFMGQLGVAMGALFLAVTLLEGSAVIFQQPCLEYGDPLVWAPYRRWPLALVACLLLLPFLPLVLLLPLGGIGTAFAHSTGDSYLHIGWNWDPLVVVPLLLLGVVYVRGVRAILSRAPGAPLPDVLAPWRIALFVLGYLALVVALVSPVDPLGDVLFAAHMVQHMLLMLVAAPLLVLGAPPALLLWGLPAALRQGFAQVWRGWPRGLWLLLVSPAVAWITHAVALWAWHVPVLYELAVENDAVHLLEHASFFGTALLFWAACARAGTRRGMGEGMAVLYVFTTAVQAGALGALITFAPTVWYGVHAERAPAFGFTGLQDQQLAGLIMWVPGGVIYLLAALVLLGRWLTRAGAPRPGAAWGADGFTVWATAPTRSPALGSTGGLVAPKGENSSP